MSYKHLTGRLIETQRSMIGEPAIRIARSVDGITVTDDGAVTALEGDGRAVVADLAERYTDMLGNAAEGRLQAAADEFEGELALPPELGGDDEVTAAQSTESPEKSTSVANASLTPGLASDGGTIAGNPRSESASAPERADEPRQRDPGPAISGPAREDDDGAIAESDAETEESGSTASRSDATVTEYTLASTVPTEADEDLDLASVYLMPAGDEEWQSPVSVETAVRDALADATDLGESGVETVLASIDRARLFATLGGENGETVSFHGSDVTLTFHRSGALAVH